MGFKIQNEANLKIKIANSYGSLTSEWRLCIGKSCFFDLDSALGSSIGSSHWSYNFQDVLYKFQNVLYKIKLFWSLRVISDQSRTI